MTGAASIRGPSRRRDCAAWPTGSTRWGAGCRSSASPRTAPPSPLACPSGRQRMDSPLRIVLAEDNYLVREGTRRLLEDSGEVSVLATVGTAAELLDAVARLHPDAVLTDIRMPPGHHTEG